MLAHSCIIKTSSIKNERELVIGLRTFNTFVNDHGWMRGRLVHKPGHQQTLSKSTQTNSISTYIVITIHFLAAIIADFFELATTKYWSIFNLLFACVSENSATRLQDAVSGFFIVSNDCTKISKFYSLPKIWVSLHIFYHQNIVRQRMYSKAKLW